MVKKSRPVPHPKNPGDKNIALPKFGGGKDLLGQRHRIIKQVDNNTLYGAGALVLLAGGGYIALQNGWLNNIPFISSLIAPTPTQTTVAVTPNAVPQGASATATGSFAKAAPNTFYAVYNSIGTAVLNGTLGSNVTTFNTPLATQSLPTGTYTIVVSDSPITGPPPGAVTGQAAGQVLGVNQQLQDNFVPTGTTLQTVAGPQNAGQSAPSNITLG